MRVNVLKMNVVVAAAHLQKISVQEFCFHEKVWSIVKATKVETFSLCHLPIMASSSLVV